MTEGNQESSYKIAEFNSLRDEILRSDRTCLLITGYLISAVAVLLYNNLQWLTSFFSFIALYYFTEKRFIIRQIATYIEKNLKDVSQWEEEVKKLRKTKPGLRPTNLLRPYNSEIVICLSIAFLPLFVSDMRDQLLNNMTGSTIVWLIFFLSIVYFSVINGIKYNWKKENWKIDLIIAFLTALAGFVLTKIWWISAIAIILFGVYIFAENILIQNKNT